MVDGASALFLFIMRARNDLLILDHHRSDWDFILRGRLFCLGKSRLHKLLVRRHFTIPHTKRTIENAAYAAAME